MATGQQDLKSLIAVADAVEAIDVPQVGRASKQLRTKIVVGLSVLTTDIRRLVREAAQAHEATL